MAAMDAPERVPIRPNSLASCAAGSSTPYIGHSGDTRSFRTKSRPVRSGAAQRRSLVVIARRLP